MNRDFSIQVTKSEVMVWCKTPDGRRVCVRVFASRLEASLFIERCYLR